MVIHNIIYLPIFGEQLYNFFYFVGMLYVLELKYIITSFICLYCIEYRLHNNKNIEEKINSF